MKFKYLNEDVRKKMISISKRRKDLFDRFVKLKTKVQGLDYQDFDAYIKEELSKGKNNRNKEIKEIDNGKTYEFRLPPHDKKGVLRVYFVIEPDFYTICITKVEIKKRN